MNKRTIIRILERVYEEKADPLLKMVIDELKYQKKVDQTLIVMFLTFLAGCFIGLLIAR